GAGQVAVPAAGVADQQGEGPAVGGGVVVAVEEDEGGVAEQGAVGAVPDVGDHPQPVGHGRGPAGGALVAGPPVDGPAHGGGFLLGEDAQQLAGPAVRAVGECLGEGVGGAVAVGVQQRLRCRRHGRVRGGGQRPVVVEPADQLRDGPDGVGGEQPGGGVEEAGAGLAGRAVGVDEPPQEGEAGVRLQREGAPEGGTEFRGYGAPLL